MLRLETAKIAAQCAAMPRPPRSAYDQTLGLAFFPRTLDKIRLHAAGELPAEYHANLGQGADARLCRFLRIEYDKLRERVLAGGADEEILEWCFETGRRLSEEDRQIYTKFSEKLGWRDEDNGATQRLEKFKSEAGLGHRDDILTIFDFFEVDEGRRK